MKVVDLLKISRDLLKLLHENGISVGDYLYLPPHDWLILRELQEIKRRQSWWLDLGSNVAGNAIFDGAVWLFSKLIKKI